MMSQTLPVCNDVRSVVVGPSYYGSSALPTSSSKERSINNNKDSNSIFNSNRKNNKQRDIMVSQFIPAVSISTQQQHYRPSTDFYRNSTTSNNNGTTTGDNNDRRLSSSGVNDIIASNSDTAGNIANNNNKDDVSTRKLFLPNNNNNNNPISSSNNNNKRFSPTASGIVGHHQPVSQSSASHLSTNTTTAITTPSCSSRPVAIMTCSAEGQDPQQAQPLLVGVKVINDWPNRNGSIGAGSSSNDSIKRQQYRRNNNNNNDCTDDDHRRRRSVVIGGDDDKLDIYSLNGGPIAIDVPLSCDSKNGDYPHEKFKTFVALLILLFSFFFTTVSLAIVHDRVPDRTTYKPLPDTFLDMIPARDWALSVSEVFIMITTNIMLFIVLAHRHRFIVFRRLFLLLSLLYFMRSITMFVTVLPVSSQSYECSEKVAHPTIDVILLRALRLCSGLGLTINGKHTYCGDYIYSGHTTILVMSYLMICEYSPRRYWLLHWSAWTMAFTGVIMVLVSHGHYTVDVIVAYFVTTRLFWLYHTLANNDFLKERSATNYLSREWWFAFFRYFEGNVKGPIPLEYDCPIKWPRFWSGSYRCGNS